MNATDVLHFADRLIDAYDQARTIAPITESDAAFDVDTAYAVLLEMHARRVAGGWRPVGRKIGFTNRTIWDRYGVNRPMWAHMYANTVQHAPDRIGALSMTGLVQPRLEPEVAFGLRGPVTLSGNARDVLDAVEWVAPGFEIVQCHFPEWRFTAADCTADFGLHGAFVVGPGQALDDRDRDRLARLLPEFELTLRCADRIVERGRGSHVLDSPVLALQHLARLVARQPEATPLGAGEIVTTGTLTDAQPVGAGQRWRSDYGELGLPGLELCIR